MHKQLFVGEVLYFQNAHQGWLLPWLFFVPLGPMVVLGLIFSRMNCTVHPSRGEGFGLVPLQSLACETPVIAPAVTGMTEYLTPDRAICLPPGPPTPAHHPSGRAPTRVPPWSQDPAVPRRPAGSAVENTAPGIAKPKVRHGHDPARAHPGTAPRAAAASAGPGRSRAPWQRRWPPA